jgi:hypothetical protein
MSNNVLAFPQDRIKGRRLSMSCQVYEFKQPLLMDEYRPEMSVSVHLFNPFVPWFIMACAVAMAVRS